VTSPPAIDATPRAHQRHGAHQAVRRPSTREGVGVMRYGREHKAKTHERILTRNKGWQRAPDRRNSFDHLGFGGETAVAFTSEHWPSSMW